MNFSKEQKDYIIHALEHCEVLTGGRSSGKTLELIKQQDKEIKRLHSIINEAREYIDSKEYVGYGIIEVDEMKIRKILDKGE